MFEWLKDYRKAHNTRTVWLERRIEDLSLGEKMRPVDQSPEDQQRNREARELELREHQIQPFKDFTTILTPLSIVIASVILTCSK